MIPSGGRLLFQSAGDLADEAEEVK